MVLVMVVMTVFFVKTSMFMAVFFVRMFMGMMIIAAGGEKTVRMQKSHVMIMVLMLRIQHDMKITRVKRRLLHPADDNLCPFQMEAVESSLKHLPVCAQIQKRANGHISADARRSI